MEREIDPRSFRRYDLDGGWIVLVGKTDADNDELSLNFREANDYWFHVEDVPGSHVLLLNQEGEEPRRPILHEAAAIAAWHSKGRKAKKIGVTMTLAKNISKKRGAPKGQVLVKSRDVIRVVPGLPEGN
jgi:predicted ribosome quality control (RQC) complex YloA/Tae2 family protein